MGFIIATERRHWKTRMLYLCMYVLVSAGALTMLYPFLIMISGSLKCRVDFDEFEVIPSYLSDNALLFRKLERARYNANAWRYQFSTLQTTELFEDIRYPKPFRPQVGKDIADFIRRREFPTGYMTPGEAYAPGVVPYVLRKWRKFLYDRFDGDITALNDKMDLAVRSWDTVQMPEVNMLSRNNIRGHVPFENLYYDAFRPTIPLRHFWPVHCRGLFFTSIRTDYGRDIANFNSKYGTDFSDFAEIPFPRRYPAGAPYAPEWERFVREYVNLLFLRIRPGGHEAYRRFLASRYGDIQAFNKVYGSGWDGFEQVPVPLKRPEKLPASRDWKLFVEKGDCLDAIEIDSFEFRYVDFLKERYGSIGNLRAAHGLDYESFDTAPLDLEQYDAWLLREHRGAIVREFLFRNYLQAIDYLVLHGRAFWVTFVFCSLNVLGHLIVNPLAAYALSRYKLRYAHWVLLFCLLTMAFPAEVGTIPRFLLIRELGMLNTIWALVLPGLAHGFSIFILKGFFDGLPKELYEAALIEGCSERWMMWNVTLSLTKPILAVTAFGSFMTAYGAFMFALIICPDERMWTISVWLYQFQQIVTEPVAFAGLVLASLPVLAAFLVAQRFILQGIVLPVER